MGNPSFFFASSSMLRVKPTGNRALMTQSKAALKDVGEPYDDGSLKSPAILIQRAVLIFFILFMISLTIATTASFLFSSSSV